MFNNQPDWEKENKAFENPPICCGCDKPCDKKYIGNNKSEMWGETDEFAKHPYHWNQCEDCFKKESGEDESEDESEDEYEFNRYGFSTVYKVVIKVSGGGMANGNAYATVEGEWANEDDYNNGEDGEVYYCEYGPNPVREWRGERIIDSVDGNSFDVE